MAYGIMEEMQEAEERETRFKAAAKESRKGVFAPESLFGDKIIMLPTIRGFGRAHFVWNRFNHTYTYICDSLEIIYTHSIPESLGLFHITLNFQEMADWIFEDFHNTDLRPFGFGQSHETIYKKG